MQQQQQVNEGSSQPKPVNVVSTVSQKKVCATKYNLGND